MMPVCAPQAHSAASGRRAARAVHGTSAGPRVTSMARTAASYQQRMLKAADRLPCVSTSRGARLVAHAIESYMVDKLRAAEQTFKELQLRMADPDVAGNSTEFQKVCSDVVV